MSKRKVVLAGACRTAIGTMGGQLSSIPAPDLGAMAIKEALKRAGVKPEQVDEVYMGNVIQAGLGQNPARQAAINAGVNSTCYAAASDALNGASPVPGTPLYFNTHSGSYQLGAHYFS